VIGFNSKSGLEDPCFAIIVTNNMLKTNYK